MARLSKPRQAEDVGTTPATITNNADDLNDTEILPAADLDQIPNDLEDAYTFHGHAEDADDERRESVVTTTSISSFPESAILSDNDPVTPILNLYTPRLPRSSFRWAGSSARAERMSPSPLGSRSPRRAKLGSRSRVGTPRSMGNIDFRGSPRHRRRISEATETQTEVGENQYPLVLLHVTLLPIRLPWSNEVTAQLLPADILGSIRQLKAKVSETILSRGVLISHPREEYELLEERLLQALELQEERVTKCGHFRNRSSISSASDSDSGLGSSIDGSENELCAICQHHIRPAKAPVGSREKKWSIKVFAANGLLCPSAWAAAWSDMEAVDVEIQPWIDEDLRRRLDEKEVEEEVERQQRLEDEVEEHATILVEDGEKFSFRTETSYGEGELEVSQERALHQFECTGLNPQDLMAQPWTDEVPDIYQPSQIPLSLLLQNYFYLLSKDWRNMALAAITTIAIFLWFQLPGGSRVFSDLGGDAIPNDSFPIQLNSSLHPEMMVAQDRVFPDLGMEGSHLEGSVDWSPPLASLAREKGQMPDDVCTISLFSIAGEVVDEGVCSVEWG